MNNNVLATITCALAVCGFGVSLSIAQTRTSPVTAPVVETRVIPLKDVIVCSSTCRDLATARVFRVQVGAMPGGNFQISGLAPGAYAVASFGFVAKQYTVGRNGVLDGRLGTHRRFVNLENTPGSVDGIAFCSSSACYPHAHQCANASGTLCNAIEF